MISSAVSVSDPSFLNSPTGRYPAAIAKRTTPAAQMSAFLPSAALLSRMSSGARYSGEPGVARRGRAEKKR
jgi:hypothetical protein